MNDECRYDGVMRVRDYPTSLLHVNVALVSIRVAKADISLRAIFAYAHCAVGCLYDHSFVESHLRSTNIKMFINV